MTTTDRILLCEHISMLSSREREVIARRFGLLGEPETLATIAASFGLTGERVRQIEGKAIRALVRLQERDPAGCLARAVAM